MVARLVCNPARERMPHADAASNSDRGRKVVRRRVADYDGGWETGTRNVWPRQFGSREQMQYDRDGFPIPPEFGPPAADQDGDHGAGGRRPLVASPRRVVGSAKRWLLLVLLLGGVAPALLLPQVLPLLRSAVVEWSLESAAASEGRGRLDAAIGHVDRGLRWVSVDDGRMKSRLLCWRAMLRLENRDLAGAIADASLAARLTPQAAEPRRVRALAHVVARNPDAALADAEAAVQFSTAGSPVALNHRAYIRALVGRDLPAALEDIDAALAEAGAEDPEFLDTKGFILHLLGRHREAIDLLNVSIDAMQQRRKQLVRAGVGEEDRAAVAAALRTLDHGLAVMHQHRGLACEAAGLEGQARQDFELAKRKGFAPERGIF